MIVHPIPTTDTEWLMALFQNKNVSSFQQSPSILVCLESAEHIMSATTKKTTHMGVKYAPPASSEYQDIWAFHSL